MIKDNGSKPKGIKIQEECGLGLREQIEISKLYEKRVDLTEEFKDFYDRIYKGLEKELIKTKDELPELPFNTCYNHQPNCYSGICPNCMK